MASGIANLGGATLDLQGGEYLISAPLAMPDFRGECRGRGAEGQPELGASLSWGGRGGLLHSRWGGTGPLSRVDSGGAGARCSSLTDRAAAGNWRIRGGTLRASPHFPSHRFLIEVGTDTCTPKDHQKVCSEFVGMDNIFLDGGHSAAGCLKVSLTMCARPLPLLSSQLRNHVSKSRQAPQPKAQAPF